jgi:propanol-preferring alcohol dehydrogenase
LHVVDGELPNPMIPIIPGHEVVGRIDALGTGVEGLQLGERVGIPWLGHTCGVCSYCKGSQENLCDQPLFNGYTQDGGFATAMCVDARFAFPLGELGEDAALAPLLCAGLIGWRALTLAGPGKKLGLYVFGAAAHNACGRFALGIATAIEPHGKLAALVSTAKRRGHSGLTAFSRNGDG